MKESVIIQKLIQVGQMLERGELEYSGAEEDTIYYLEQYAALHQPHIVWQSEQLVCEHSFVWENPNNQDCLKRRCELCGYIEAN